MLSHAILETDFIIAVGPFVSAPWVGLIPSESGVQALRPFGVAPVICPKGVLFEIESVPWLNIE